MNEYLLTREVAALLRAPDSTVTYWRHEGTGPPSIKVGRRVLYRRDAVLAWLHEREHASEDGAPRVSAQALIASRVRPRSAAPSGRAR